MHCLGQDAADALEHAQRHLSICFISSMANNLAATPRSLAGDKGAPLGKLLFDWKQKEGQVKANVSITPAAWR